jgi:hypothetical protein
MPRKPTPPGRFPRKGSRPQHPRQPAQVTLSSNWSPAISRMWLEPVEHDDELAEAEHERTPDDGD